MSGEGARLIVVDDEPQIRGMIVDYLGRSGYAAHGCASGAELDVALASQPADLVVLDVSMPGEDGVSIARRLSATGATAIIMLTVLDDVVDKIVGFEVGVDDYLTKPFDLRELRARIRAVLKRVRTPGGDQAVPSTADIERLRRFPSASSTSTSTRDASSTGTAPATRSPPWSSTCWRRLPAAPTG